MVTPTPTKAHERLPTVLVRGRGGRMVCLVLLSLAGCDFPGKPNPADQPIPPEKILEFAALYAQNCSGCHGAAGELGPAPPLRNDLFRAIIPESELEQVVSKGRPGTPMPAFAKANGGILTPAQIQVLVFGIKGIRYRIDHQSQPDVTTLKIVRDPQGTTPPWGVPPPAPANVPPYLVAQSEPQRNSEFYEQIRKTVFARACATCHGNDGQGAEKAGAIHDPALLSLASDQFLRRLVITGRPDLGMPAFAGTSGRAADFHPLDSQEVADLVKLLGYWRRGGQSASEVSKPELEAKSNSPRPIQKAVEDAKSS